MEEKKQLYPLQFIPIASKSPWGGDALIRQLGKDFVEADEEGNEHHLTTEDRIGESWEIADMGFRDSLVSEGWLAGNSISDLMETYLDRIVGEKVFNQYGRQFPLLIKYLDINDKLSVQVHPDDETAIARYDSLGKAEMWYIMDVKPGARIYAGFKREVSAQELYDRCQAGTVEEILNVIEPAKGDAIMMKPGTVHAADGGIVIAEIQESSNLTFRLYDWGREKNPATARPIHLAEAMDIIDYGAFDPSCWIRASEEPLRTLVDRQELTVTEMRVKEPLRIDAENSGVFHVYMCVEGEVSIQQPHPDPKGGTVMDNILLKRGSTVLIPADMGEFYIVPRSAGSVVLEATAGLHEAPDSYINPDTEAFLEGEDYEGLENEDGGKN